MERVSGAPEGVVLGVSPSRILHVQNSQFAWWTPLAKSQRPETR
jgi:hypothetical protein